MQPAGMAEWIAGLFVERAACHQISLLPKLVIHCCLPSTTCMRDVWKAILLYTCLHLMVEMAGVVPDVTQASKCAGERITLALNHG